MFGLYLHNEEKGHSSICQLVINFVRTYTEPFQLDLHLCATSFLWGEGEGELW